MTNRERAMNVLHHKVAKSLYHNASQKSKKYKIHIFKEVPL